MILQLTELSADGRLRQAEGFRGGRHIPVLRHGGEGDQA